MITMQLSNTGDLLITALSVIRNVDRLRCYGGVEKFCIIEGGKLPLLNSLLFFCLFRFDGSVAYFKCFWLLCKSF